MTNSSSLFLILAAGQGTRMRSSLAKVLHAVAGRPMLHHVMAVGAAGDGHTAVVTAPHMDDVREAALAFDPGVQTFVQAEQLGTAHAVLAAKAAIEACDGPVFVLYGDTPLLSAGTIEAMGSTLRDGADVVVLGFEAFDPTGYGRLLLDEDGQLSAIREEKDADEEEKAVTFCNSGVFAFGGGVALRLLERVGNDNAKGEYYLTDVVEIARGDGLSVGVVTCAEEEVLGVNSRAELAEAESQMQWRLREAVMESGVTLIAPETVFFSHDTRLEADVVVEPNVVFAPGVRVGTGARIRAFSHLEGADVGEGAIIGPYARLRPGAVIESSARIGNFVEIKAAKVEEGAKVNHLTYIGDARVGRGANVGAGTITCNYDGYFKHHTDIGAGAFIGSNSALVAPVKIGDGAYIGSGSVITKNVSGGALAVTRAKQEEREGWAAKFQALKAREKAKNS